jgi:SRSO17 transposase
MPKPIVCVSEQLRQYLDIFRSCFSQRQWRYFVIVLLGLIECEERKTMTGLLRVIGERISLSGLSRFLNKWPWSPEAVAQSWQAHFRQQLKPLVQAEHERLKALAPKGVGRPKQTVVTGYLIFDDSVHEKPKGRKMGGLGSHYSTTAQKVVVGHCLFSGLYVLLGQRCPLAARMYCQQSVCEQEKQPFQSKVEMAVDEIEQFEPVAGTKTHVLIDSWYHCRQLRRAAQKRGWEVSGALKSNRWMRRMRPDGSREWLKLSDYAAALRRDEWCEIIWPSQEGEQRLYGHLVSTWVRKLGPTLLLITCHDLDAPPKTRRFWGSTLVDVDAQVLVEILAIRWQVETFFEYEKDLLGSDHYQVMSRQAVLRFWTLTACLLYFLDMQRNATALTCGDVRRLIQHQHRRNLLIWLTERLRDGLSSDQIAFQLAL